MYNQFKKQETPAIAFTCLMSSLFFLIMLMDIIMILDILRGSFISFFLKKVDKSTAFAFVILLSFSFYVLYVKVLNLKKIGDRPDGLFQTTNNEKIMIWLMITIICLSFFILATMLNNAHKYETKNKYKALVAGGIYENTSQAIKQLERVGILKQ